MERRRSVTYALFTSAAAALGLLVVRTAFSFVPSLTFDFVADRLTYLYVFLVTASVFLLLGYLLGRRIDELRRLSTTDPLTELANRRAFEQRLNAEWQRSRRDRTPLSLLLIDIDGLKRVNDEDGHAAGDVLLRAAARSIRATMRVTDCGARWGGDEFAMIAPNTRPRAAEHLGHRLMAHLADPAQTGHPTAIAVSIGIATVDPLSTSELALERLLELADSALYRAKIDGRNRIRVA